MSTPSKPIPPAQSEFGFCTLALGKKYALLAAKLANDLRHYAPGIPLIALTDQPEEFATADNVIAIPHRQQGILHCYHDKRFAIQQALLVCNSAIMIDADTNITKPLPIERLKWQPGLTAGHQANLVEHVKRYNPERLPHVEGIAAKLSIPLETVTYVGESLFVVSRDGGKEQEFIEHWGSISRYLELRRVYAGAGISMGLAAAKVGWQPMMDNWDAINEARHHTDASYSGQPRTMLQQLKYRLKYHYRLNKTRLMALNNFSFYYL